jgi:hypothetical protein
MHDIYDLSGKDTVCSDRWDSIRFVQVEPGPGFSSPDFDDRTWSTAPTLAEAVKALRTDGAGGVWLRLTRHYAELHEFNNLFFRIRHNGNIRIWINGDDHSNEHQLPPGPLEQLTNRYLTPIRSERIGRNVYAVYFEWPQDIAPVLELITVADRWHVTLDVIPKQNAVIDRPLRDAFVCPGADGFYYMTGTLGDERFHNGTPCWLENDGIPLFRSANLQDWTYLGLVWTFEGCNATWVKDFEQLPDGNRKRAIYAPHLDYIRGKYWLSYCVNHCTRGHSMGIGLAWADKPEGPYTDVSPDRPVVDCTFDPALFADDDGAVYILGNGGWIRRLNDAMDGTVGKHIELTCANYNRPGYEGVFLFKHAGKYHLCVAEWNRQTDGHATYDCNIAVSDHVMGPYSRRYTAIRGGGHNNIFPGPGGRLYSTIWEYFGPGTKKEHPSICPLETDVDGLFRPSLPV